MTHPTLPRLERLRHELANLSLDGAWISYLPHVRYYTGFSGSNGVLLILPDGNLFLTDSRYTQQAAREVPHCEIHIDAPPGPGESRPHPGLPGLAHRLRFISGELNLGFDDLHLSVAAFNSLQMLFPQAQWTPLPGFFDELAAVKDDAELAALRKAIEITDQVFEALQPELKVGAVERQIAARIATLCRELGGDGDAFEPIVASGPNGALPHAQPSDRAFEPGDFVVMDFGARYQGYHADMTRTVCISPATDKHRMIYQSVLEAQGEGIRGIRDGVQAAEIDQLCRSYLDARGLGEGFNHSTGHGIGLEVHTPPRLSSISADVLKANMVVTVEPGVYLPGWGGVRIEDDILVTAEGGEPLNTSPKELLVL